MATVLNRSRSVETIWACVGTGTMGLGLAILYLIPEIVYLAPKCVLKISTGVPCPTCGGTRALWALMAGHPLEALAWNPLLGVLAVAGAIYLPYAWLVAGGVIAPIRTGWLTAPMPVALRWLLPAAVALNWVYLLLAGA